MIGANGAGKTTLFRMITGEESARQRQARPRRHRQLAYVDQSRDSLNPEKTVWEEISEGYEHIKVGEREVNSRQYTAGFNFKGSDQQARIGKLSGGERNRVHLAKLLRSGGNLLLLDEPTNDLDVDTLRALENALLEFPGCAVVISHDRWFLNRVATHVLAFEGDSQVTWFEGNFDAYEEHRHATARSSRRPPPPDHLQAPRPWLTIADPPASPTAGFRPRHGRRAESIEQSTRWRARSEATLHRGYLTRLARRSRTARRLSGGDPAPRADRDRRRPLRSPRSLTIHYARAPEPGPVSIHTTIERAGRSLSTLSARIEQDGALVALALAAFSVPWTAPEVYELPMPEVAPPDAVTALGQAAVRGRAAVHAAPVLQPRIGVIPFQGASEPMEVGAWLGLAEPRPIDALSLAFFCDAMFSPPFIRIDQPATSPTIDLTIHFRAALPPTGERDPDELCFARFRSGRVHEGFFEEDGVIWARRRIAARAVAPARDPDAAHTQVTAVPCTTG